MSNEKTDSGDINKNPRAAHCVECGCDLDEIISQLCPECATPVDAKPFKRLRAFYIHMAIVNGVVLMCLCYLLFFGFEISSTKGNPDALLTMSVLGVGCLTALAGLITSIYGARASRELAWNQDRKTRVVLMNLALLPLWYTGLLILISFINDVVIK